MTEEELNTQFLLWVISFSEAGKEYFKKVEAHKTVYYLLKIFDFLWFEPDIPEDDDRPFHIFLNGHWPGNPSFFFSDVAKLHNETLSYLSRKITRPKWLDGNTLYTEVSIKDSPRSWTRIEANQQTK